MNITPDREINGECKPLLKSEIFELEEQQHREIEVIKNFQGVEFLLPPPQINPSGFLVALRKSYRSSQPLHVPYRWIEVIGWLITGCFILPAFWSAPYHWRIIGLMVGWILSGFSLLYASMKFRFGKESIQLTERQLHLGISFMGRRHSDSYEMDRIKEFRLTSDYREHDGHLCFEYDEQTVGFGHSVNLEAARWLFDILKKRLFTDLPKVRAKD